MSERVSFACGSAGTSEAASVYTGLVLFEVCDGQRKADHREAVSGSKSDGHRNRLGLFGANGEDGWSRLASQPHTRVLGPAKLNLASGECRTSTFHALSTEVGLLGAAISRIFHFSHRVSSHNAYRICQLTQIQIALYTVRENTWLKVLLPGETIRSCTRRGKWLGPPRALSGTSSLHDSSQ